MSTGDRQDLLHVVDGDLLNSISSSATSMTVVTRDGTWPDVFPFYVTIDEALEQIDPPPAAGHEIVRVDGITGNVHTIVRAQLGTSARVHSAHATVALGANRNDVARLLAHLETAGHGPGGASEFQVERFSLVGPATAPVVGKGRMTFERAATIRTVRATVDGSGTHTIDVHKNGTTIFTTQSNRPQIVAGNTDLADAIDVPAIAAGQYLTADLDSGNLAAGQVLVVDVEYTVD